MQVWRMPTGISFALAGSDRRRLDAIIDYRNARKSMGFHEGWAAATMIGADRA